IIIVLSSYYHLIIILLSSSSSYYYYWPEHLSSLRKPRPTYLKRGILEKHPSTLHHPEERSLKECDVHLG
ncbi:hypothetical protein BDF14DRAFT_1986860, partial [Spinellus fusiger]